jgi:L-histidine Nalpha-methyltransferase
MSEAATITIHPSQFPEQVRRDLCESLRRRQVNHKFHYDSPRQTQKWLALHQAYAPSRTDQNCAATYDRSFKAAVSHLTAPVVHLLGLGCGGGQKDTRLLRLLQAAGKTVFYTPADVSSAMVLVARQAALEVLPPQRCFPLVCDLATAHDLPRMLESTSKDTLRSAIPASAARLITFFGMIPNFEPGLILPRLAALVRQEDHLLFSANLAPGPDYAAGVQRILPLYDNALTRDWLLTFLFDLGVQSGDGRWEMIIEDDPAGSGLKRVAAYFRFERDCRAQLDEELFPFQAGESIRLFFSYRHTPALVRSLLASHGLQAREQWLADSEEEGVFLFARATTQKPM